MTPLLAVDAEHQAGSLALRIRFTLHARRAALFGPSGAGKTTLLRMLAGLARPTRGAITFDGRLLADPGRRIHVPPAEREIGFVTQSPALFPHLTVEENVRFGLQPKALRNSAWTQELLDLFELSELRTRLPRGLSGGEQQRVALARALAPPLKLLLLDEPFSALDATRKTRLWIRLEEHLRVRSIAMLLVSHDAAEVWSRADTVLRMEAGVATEQGPPAQMLHAEREQVLRQLGAR